MSGRYEWYQDDRFVVICLFIKQVPLSKENVILDLKHNEVDILIEIMVYKRAVLIS